MKKSLIFVALLLSSAIQAQPTDLAEGFNFECEFDKHYATYLTADKTEKYSKGITKLNIIDEATYSRTRSLDGSERATNSDKWSLVSSFEFQRTYIGSDGDLLNIYYRPDDDPKEHIASLQWGTILGYTYTSIGVCFASP